MKGEIFVESPSFCVKFGKHRYYISNYGHMISFANPNKPILKTPDKSTFRPKHTGEGNREQGAYKDYIYRLVAEAFDVYAYGLATNNSEVHHIRKYNPKKGIIFNSNAQYLQYVTKKVHRMLLSRLEKTPNGIRDLEEELQILHILAELAGEEAPDTITVLSQDIISQRPDHRETKIFTTQELTFSKEGKEELEEVISNVSDWYNDIRNQFATR